LFRGDLDLELALRDERLGGECLKFPGIHTPCSR